MGEASVTVRHVAAFSRRVGSALDRQKRPHQSSVEVEVEAAQ
jgi:hypothetical protein